MMDQKIKCKMKAQSTDIIVTVNLFVCSAPGRFLMTGRTVKSAATQCLGL